MKMITLFLPEKYIEIVDMLVANNLYPNRSEALRTATWDMINKSIHVLSSAARARSTDDELADAGSAELNDELASLLAGASSS